MLARVELREIAIQALKEADTLAQGRVFGPTDYPTANPKQAVILVNTPKERKISNVRTTPNFTTTAALALSARVSAESEAEAVQKIEQLSEQIESTLLTSQELIREIQQFSYVDTQISLNGEGRNHYAEALFEFGLEFFEVFTPDTAGGNMTPLEGVDMSATSPYAF